MDLQYQKFVYGMQECPLKRTFMTVFKKDSPWGCGPGESSNMGSRANWRRLERLMARRNWKQLLVRGETEGNALVFLAVPR